MNPALRGQIYSSRLKQSNTKYKLRYYGSRGLGHPGTYLLTGLPATLIATLSLLQAKVLPVN
jgi:hypothetical protein